MTVIESINALRGVAQEMEALSLALSDVERKLEPVEDEYDAFIRDFETGLWERHVNDDAKFPSARMRLQLAHREMSPELYGRYFALVKSRKRIEKRIAALKAAADAQRSILSAEKEAIA